MNISGNNTVESLDKNTIENSDSCEFSTNLYVVIEAMELILNIVKIIIGNNIVFLNIFTQESLFATKTNGITVDTFDTFGGQVMLILCF